MSLYKTWLERFWGPKQKQKFEQSRWNNMLDQRTLPPIYLRIKFNYSKSFTAPNPDVNGTVYDPAHTVIGRVTYALSPLIDRVYVFNIEIEEPYRRKGYGLAVIQHLIATYHLPMTTIKEVFSASAFWAAARTLTVQTQSTISTISVSEMPEEAARWAHLRPEVDKLDALITQRLLRGEPYEVAVGRGLEE